MPDGRLPDWTAHVRQRLAAMRIGPARENEIVLELAGHLDQAYTDAINSGASEAEAFRQAEAWFSNWRQLAHEIEHVQPRVEPDRPASLFAGGMHDIRHALRFLRRNPAFAGIAIGTLALGIGGNTAIFSMADAISLRAMPYPQSDRLMTLESFVVKQHEIEPWTSAPDFFDFRERAHSFSSLAGISPIWNDVLTGGAAAERLETLYVSATFFPMLGVKPALGRTFTTAEDNGAHPSHVAVVSYAFWRRHFGMDPKAVGASIILNGASYGVTGVLPEDFRYAGEPLTGKTAEIDVWMPLSDNQLAGVSRSVRFLKVIGRLKAGVAPQQACDEIRSIGQALVDQYPATNRSIGYTVVPLADRVGGRYRGAMFLLLGAVGFVLLMACVNVANLLLARTAGRGRDVAVRVALGASRYRVLRQLMTEGAALAIVGGLVGLLLALWGIGILAALAPISLAPPGAIALNRRALFFTLTVTAAAALMAGLPAAWNVARNSIQSALRQGGRGLTRGSHRLRSTLVAIEVAAALVLLAGAGLLIHSFQRVLAVPPGFDVSGIVTFSMQSPVTTTTGPQRKAEYEAVKQKLMTVAGVSSVAAVTRLPLMGSNLGTSVFIEGKTRPGEPLFEAEFRGATPDYFSTMGIPLISGRFFDDHDLGQTILINRSMERRLWGVESALGKRLKLGPDTARQPWVTVIGVVGDIHHFGLDSDVRPEIYRSYASNPFSAPIVVVRTRADASALAGTIGTHVRSVDPQVPVYNIFAMRELLDRSTAARRFVMWLVSGFALTALMLSAVGVYGTVSQAVAQRTQEIGLRMALGASPAGALALMFGDGMRPVLLGLGLGSAAALALTRLMRNLLFDVHPLDPLAFLAALATLGVFAAFACYVPARRATSVDPLVALRQEG